jgi:ADP-heptose:LPS heptosyltransferase/tetratricopeptide (TPR) repeat protein
MSKTMAAKRRKTSLRSDMLRRADEAKDRRQFLLAAEFYEFALGLKPIDYSLLLLCGHMRKEGRDFATAEQHYLRCLGASPNDAETLLQLGHFYKIVGRYTDAEQYYQNAVIARPAWDDALEELRRLRDSPELRLQKELTEPASKRLLQTDDDDPPIKGLISTALFAKTREELHLDYSEEFVITRNGNQQKTKWGTGATVRGVDSLRGFLVSAVPYLYIEIFLDGHLIYRSDLPVAPMRRERTNPALRKYVYNAWIDFSHFSYGEHELVFRAVNVRGDTREGLDWRRERIIVAEPLPNEALADSPGVVPPLDPHSPLSVVDQINALPSAVYRPSPRSYPGRLDNILVIRGDQLGDMVVSMPALRRLRELLPGSNIVGLLSPANADLAQTIGIFDEIILLNFPDDPVQRERIMERAEQEALIQRLGGYKLDLAIDFSVAGGTHKLLPLTGAAITLGYRKGGYKTVDLIGEARGPKGYEIVMRHSAWIQIMSESLALWLNSGAKVTRNDALSRAMLTPYGLQEDDEYVFLHSGSRLAFIRWPHYPELAGHILALGKKILYMADDQSQRQFLPQEALASGQLVFLAQKLPFDHFDALLSYCSVFVGNDSGPKHLASLRGVKVVSLHPARSDWREWGQEINGVILGRRVPCAGCQLHHDPEECVQGVACITKITVAEVLREVEALLVDASQTE